eukprot:2804154-Amphidinium_carterae.2
MDFPSRSEDIMTPSAASAFSRLLERACLLPHAQSAYSCFQALCYVRDLFETGFNEDWKEIRLSYC